MDNLLNVWADRLARRTHDLSPAELVAARAYYVDAISRRFPGGPREVIEEFASETPWVSSADLRGWMRDPPTPLLQWLGRRVLLWNPAPEKVGVGIACFGYRQTTGPCTSGALYGAGTVGTEPEPPFPTALVEKVIMRELTRLRGPTVTPITMATDAVNATQASQAASILEQDGCGAGSKLFAKATASGGMDWKVIACFASKFAALTPQQKSEILGVLQEGGFACLSLLTSYSSLITDALTGCPDAVKADPAYASQQALTAASWNPYDPKAGPKWQPSIIPGTNGHTTPPVLPGTTPNWACNPFPACLTDPANWPAGTQPVCTPWPDCVCQWLRQADPNVVCPTTGTTPPPKPPGTNVPPPPTGVNWGCTPFPQCLADPNNWPAGVSYPCNPWPTCAPAYLAALTRDGTQPGVQPPAASQPVEPPWYKTGWGAAAIGAGAIVVVGTIVLAAGR